MQATRFWERFIEIAVLAVGIAFLCWSIVHARHIWILNGHDPGSFWKTFFLWGVPVYFFILIILGIMRANQKEKEKSGRNFFGPAIIVAIYLGALIFTGFAPGVKISDSMQTVVFDGMCSDIRAIDGSRKGIGYSAQCGGRTVSVFPNAAVLNDSFGNPVATFHCRIYRFAPDNAECTR